MNAVFVGVDVSKDRLDTRALPQGVNFVVSRNGEGLAQLLARLLAREPGRFARFDSRQMRRRRRQLPASDFGMLSMRLLLRQIVRVDASSAPA